MANPYADYDTAGLKAFLGRYELQRDSDASYEYSDLGFGLLGFALEQLEHTSYGAMIGEEILKPLGMTMSATAFSDTMRGRLAPGHDDRGNRRENFRDASFLRRVQRAIPRGVC